MEENIIVSVRARPLNEREKTAGEQIAWFVDPITKYVVSIPDPTIHLNPYNEDSSDSSPFSGSRQNRVHEFPFDHIFEPTSTTQDVYKNVAQGIVWSSMEGFNGTIFAYGQTGSGKTFTMKGSGKKQPGIINLAIQDVWAFIQQHPEREFLLRVSYMEIYNEIVNDLLTPGNSNLKIHEDPQKGVYVGGLKEEIVVSPTHVMALLAGGDVHRHVGATNYNEQSSRSHTLFRIVIESKEVNTIGSPEPLRTPGTPGTMRFDGLSPVRASSLTLIDLAGSERSSVGTSGVRQREGSHINQSLLTLGIIIAKLSDKKAAGHVPWRDSKLTRILQPSLGGNARVAIISTITMASGNLDETLSTLKFATRAKNVKNTAKINELVEEKGLLRHYRSEIASLKAELAKALANEKTLTRDVSVKGEQEERKRGEQEEKKRIEQDATEAMAKRMAELERTRASLESKISALTKLILRGGFANSQHEEEEEREAAENHERENNVTNGNGHTPEPGTPTRSRSHSISQSPARVGQLQALIDQLHNELKLKDETQAQMRAQMDTMQQNLADAKKQIVQLQEEAVQRQRGDEWLILQSSLKEERTRATIYASADAKYRKEMGTLEAARACLELDVKVVEKERALLAAHMRVKDLRIAELEMEAHELRVRCELLEREQRKRMLMATSPR